MAFNQVITDEWTVNSDHMSSTTTGLQSNISTNSNTSVGPKKIIRNLALKRIKEVIPLENKVKLDRVLGLTVSSNTSLDCDPLTSNVVYPAGCVLVLYNIRKNKQTHVINASKKPITASKFSWDGKYVVTGECGHQPHVRVWDASTCEQVAAFSGHKFGIICVAFSPNNKYVVSVGSQHDMIVNVWDWKNNIKIASNKVSSKVKALSFASNGSYFVTVGNRHVKFWYLEYSKSSRSKFESLPLMGRSAILGDQRNNYFCDVSCGRGDMSDSTYAITKSGLLCEFNNRRLLDKWVELRTSSANCINISAGLICVGCAQGIVRCFNPKNLHFVCTLPRPHSLGIDIGKGLSRNDLSSGTNATINIKYPDTIAITLDETNNMVTCIYGDRSIYFWTITNIKKIGKLHSFLYHSSCIWAIETYPNLPNSAKQLLPLGTFFTCSSDDTIRIWNLDNLKTSQESNYVYKRNIFSAELLKILYMDPELTFISDPDMSSSANNDKVDTNYDGKNGVRSIKISPDGRHLASGDRSGNIRVFDLELQQDLCKIEAHDSEVLCLEYSDEQTYGGKSFLSSASRDRLIHIFDAKQQYSFVQTMDDHSSSITAVKFVCNKNNSNLQMISCGADKSIIFRKGVESGQQSFNFVREHHVVGKTTLYDMEVDVEQNYALTACQDRMIRVYDVITGKNTSNFKGSQGDDGTLIKIAFDPSGTFIASSCTDKSMYIYDYQSGECLAATSGHSELVTGLKFSQNGKHLISASGDGCIFVWRLPVEMSNAIASKLGLPDVPVVESPVVAIARPLQQNNSVENDENISVNNNSPSNLYRFNLKSLPLWAKKQMVEEMSRDPNASETEQQSKTQSQPKGRWAQRMENSQNLVVKSYLNEDPVIPYPKVQNNVKGDDINKIDRQATDSSSASGSYPHEDEDDLNTTDSDNIGYPEDNTYPNSCFKVNETIGNNRLRKSKSVLKRFSGIGVIPSISVPNFNELHSDDEDSNTTEADSDRIGNNKNLMYMSRENLDRIDQREKYLKNAFENLDKVNNSVSVDKPDQQSDYLSPNRSSISSKYHSKTNSTNSNSKGSPQTNGNASIQNSTISPLTAKPPISKRREELTKAISEARKKLETLGWKGSGLSNSKSVANLRDINFDSNGKNVSGSDSSEAIRRSISLSDLSFTPKRRLATSQLNLNMNCSAPIWENNKVNDLNPSEVMSRSTSNSTLSKIDSIKSQSVSIKNKGLWNNPSQTSLKPINTSGRLSAPLTQLRKTTNSYSSGHRDSSDEESLSSSSEDKLFSHARPGTPPKPNILKQIRRSSTSQAIPNMKDQTLPPQTKPRRLWNNDMRSSKSEFNLATIGRETPIKLRSNSSSSGSGLWATPPLPMIQNERIDLSMTNPSTIPLTQELCHFVVNELNSITKYAIRIFQRSSETGNTRLKEFLSHNLSNNCNDLQSVLTHSRSQPNPNIPNNDPNYSLPPETMTFLQQYSDRLLNIVEQRINKKE